MLQQINALTAGITTWPQAFVAIVGIIAIAAIIIAFFKAMSKS